MSLLAGKKTIDQIVAPMNKVIKELRAHQERAAQECDSCHKQIDDLHEKLERTEAEKQRAARLAEKYEALVS